MERGGVVATPRPTAAWTKRCHLFGHNATSATDAAAEYHGHVMPEPSELYDAADSRQLVFRSFHAETWAGFRRLATDLDDWIFRGQRVEDWQLKTSFERATEGRGFSDQEIADFECHMLYDFRRRADCFLGQVPQDSTEWLALLQHYGGPTRLLDFTRSFYAATFFALEHALKPEPAVIWALNPPLFAEASTARLRRFHPELRDAHVRLEERVFEDSIGSVYPHPMAIARDPYRLSMRRGAQQGLFVAPLSLRHSFEENLFGTFDLSPDVQHEEEPESVEEIVRAYGPGRGDHHVYNTSGVHLVKITMAPKLFKYAMRDLHQMSLDASTFFPDLEGLARSAFGVVDASAIPSQSRSLLGEPHELAGLRVGTPPTR